MVSALRVFGTSSRYATRFVSTSRVLSQEAKIVKEASPIAAAPISPPPPPPPKGGRIRSVFKWTWRAALLSALGGTAYVGYQVYKEAHPTEQIPQSDLKPNGNKRKTIVILGSGWGSITTLKHLDTSLYNVIIVSPRNYFLFTPLLPSVPTGTVDVKSITDPVRTVARATPGQVLYLEAEATDVDPVSKKVTIKHKSNSMTFGEAMINEEEPIITTVDYDYLVFGVGAQTTTFGIPGVAENASYLKEAHDAVVIRQKIFNSIEAAQLLPVGSEERKRLLSVVVCGGGPTGVELAAEVKDYIDQDLSRWLPGIEKEMTVTLVEALPNVLNAFNQKLIKYTEEVFKRQELDLRTNTMVKKVDRKNVYAVHKNASGEQESIAIPYGTLVWATGNGPREITKSLASKIEEQKTARRGLLIDAYLKVDGSDSIYALGDCTFTKNPPTAQVAHQEGIFLASHFEKLSKIDDLQYSIKTETEADKLDKLNRRLERAKASLRPFEYVYQGSLAYIGTERAVADLVWGDFSNVSTGGSLTFLFWRSAYVSMILGVRSKILVCFDWLKVGIFGRDCSKE
ncbi:unnamed protein product [Kuraishia capsulata CBS 1993]|uniref:NADH:ubiquinone reductase (non-electrogenic) n=1 Tax=Kuraishia capsulata CBS 1993 TaxID=1382522 RepID=W6MHE2_9ASCO|nr:uncharacterized protein KUCA_T00001050001 [Kuraishia capsulata CBS 1993]CDK25083.1 unnamed protein product [Kuraishia capsulata CBS 1993]